MRFSFLVIPLLIACGSSSGKPAATADESDNTISNNETATTDKATNNEAEKSVPDEVKASEMKAESKSEKKSSEEAASDDSAAVKDDSRTTASCEKVVKDNRPAFKKCYKGRTDLKGTISLQIELDAAGKIKKAYIGEESTIKDQKIYDCILDTAKTLTFPKSTKGLDKNFEYEFGVNNG
jgi:hypothetical protein